MTTKNKTPLGKALYLEFRNTSTSSYSQAFQFVLLPPAEVGGIAYKPQVLRRTVATYAPRSQWSFYKLEVPTITADSTPETYLKSLWETLLRNGGIPGRNFQRADSNWELYKTPIVVEVSEEDLEDVAKRATPNALLRRIKKVRSAQGFDESVIPVIAPSV